MPLIHVNHASALTSEQIESLMSGLTEIYTSVTNANPEAVQVLIQQIPADRWAVGGRSLADRKKNS